MGIDGIENLTDGEVEEKQPLGRSAEEQQAEYDRQNDERVAQNEEHNRRVKGTRTWD